MEDKKEELITFIIKQLKDYQKKKHNPLMPEDLNAIIELIREFITNEIESRRGFHSTLSNIVENAIIDSRIKMSEIIADLSMPDISTKDTLKTLKRSSKYKTTIKKSPLLSKIRNSSTYTSEELLENIPAIDCLIAPRNLILTGYGINGEETIYEINKGDERPSKKEIDLMSTKEALERYGVYSKSVK